MSCPLSGRPYALPSLGCQAESRLFGWLKTKEVFATRATNVCFHEIGALGREFLRTCPTQLPRGGQQPPRACVFRPCRTCPHSNVRGADLVGLLRVRACKCRSSVCPRTSESESSSDFEAHLPPRPILSLEGAVEGVGQGWAGLGRVCSGG